MAQPPAANTADLEFYAFFCLFVLRIVKMRIWSCLHYCYMAKYLKRSKKLQVLSYHGIHNTQVYIFQKTFPEMKLVSAVNICQLIPARSSIMSRASRSRVPEFTRMHILEAAEGWQLLNAGWFTLEIEIVAPQWVSGEKMGGMIRSQFPLSGIIKLDCKPAAVLPRLAPTVCDSVSLLRSGTVSVTVLELSWYLENPNLINLPQEIPACWQEFLGLEGEEMWPFSGCLFTTTLAGDEGWSGFQLTLSWTTCDWNERTWMNHRGEDGPQVYIWLAGQQLQMFFLTQSNFHLLSSCL